MRLACSAWLAGGLVIAASPQAQAAEMDAARIQALVPELEKQLQAGMKEFSVPGVAVGIVAEGKLIYGKGFGAREIGKPAQVTPETIFQIGSTTKAFFSATLAQAVDAGKLEWNDPVIDHMPAFQLADPWVTRDFRILDLAAQRSGLTPYVNDGLAFLGFDPQTMIRSLRVAPQIAPFRSDFRYLNIPHVIGGEIVAAVNGEKSWFDSLKKTVLDPLGMAETSADPETIDKAANHAVGHRLDDMPVPIPFHGSFPYSLGPAGALNSNVPDMAKWLQLQIGRGHVGEKVLVSEANLAATWTPRVAMTDRLSYAVGWVAMATPRGRVIWHNGGTTGFGAHVGFLPDFGVGIVILTNIGGPGMADALAHWFYDRVLGNPQVDNIALAAQAARKQREAERSEKAAFVAGPLPPDAAALAGDYVSPILGTARVTLKDGKLRAVLEKTEAVLLLEPSRPDPNQFSIRLSGTGAYQPIAAMIGDTTLGMLRFERDAAGGATQFRFVDPGLPHAFARQAAE
ncbi:hypothetical protein ASE63_16720 [Bosea sp. Root381]|uniref:serine hydrolase domain-containing protein n=1 Tax=Bosea sp. Root381 TaxID=1736524 RepID=UPI0006FF3237|nr:serine hydrolase domain-containing protein [Bosea sp. Root381]KRE15863.1 hypothetical protein ASE63_16720 [Bosea sp. Root381]